MRLPALLACLAALSLPVISAAQTQIAITFDDLPAHSTLPPGVTRQQVGDTIIAALKAAHIRDVYGFVNAKRIDEDPATIHVLEAWRAAGFPLGNHTYSHMNLSEHTPAEWEADTTRGEPVLQQLMGGGDWHWLRFPYLAEGNNADKQNAARAFLKSHGYRVAGVTMSFGDYAYNEPYARCSAKGDAAAIAHMETEYLAGAEDSLSTSRAMSQTLLHREIPFVLLMHLGAFDARMLPRLLTLYRDSGVRFVALEEAEKDPFYKPDTDLSLPYTPDSLEGHLAEAKLPFPQHTPQPPADLDKLCR